MSYYGEEEQEEDRGEIFTFTGERIEDPWEFENSWDYDFLREYFENDKGNYVELDDDWEEDTDEKDDKVTIGKEGSGSDIEIKNGIDISKLQKEMTDTFKYIDKAWEVNTDDKTPVLTETYQDPGHMIGSLHYDNGAIDIQAKD